MMRGSLFEGLPPPSEPPQPPSSPSPPAVLALPIKALPESAIRAPSAATGGPGKRASLKSDGAGAKRVRFQSNEVGVSEEQVLGAIGKITSHIGNPSKFSKASRLALQLLQTISVNGNTSDAFFGLLRAAMLSPSRAFDVKLWSDYHALFTALLEKLECFSVSQQAQIEVWELWAILANEFRTDDTFVFSKASARVRQSLDALPDVNEEDELACKEGEADVQEPLIFETSSERCAHDSSLTVGSERKEKSQCNENDVESDPFGLNALMPEMSKKEERVRKTKDEEAASFQAHKETHRLRQERRAALISCLEIAADKYRCQWAQTIIDILVKYAFDASAKFTASQRHTIEKLWGSVREQLVTRKHSKPASGKLDVTPFERLQSQYAREHISIRKAVGRSGPEVLGVVQFSALKQLYALNQLSYHKW